MSSPSILKVLALISSYIFHPIFLLFYSLFLLLCLKPHLFGVLVWSEQTVLLLLTFIYTVFIPSIAIGLMRWTGLLKTFSMADRFDRFIPLIICAVFNLWLWINLKSQDQIPKLMTAFVLSAVICIFLAFIINTTLKMSLHTAAWACFCTLWVFVRKDFSQDLVFLFRFEKEAVSSFHLHALMAFSIILAGWVGSCRLYLKAHTPDELFIGYIVGVISTILAFSYTF